MVFHGLTPNKTIIKFVPYTVVLTYPKNPHTELAKAQRRAQPSVISASLRDDILHSSLLLRYAGVADKSELRLVHATSPLMPYFALTIGPDDSGVRYRATPLLFRPYRIFFHWRGCGIRPYASCKILGAQVAGECIIRIKVARSNRALKCYAGKVYTLVKSFHPNFGNSSSNDHAYKA